MARGGARDGRPGVSYPNRTDLNPAKPLPPTVAPGQQYGQGQAQRAAQQRVPMGPAPAAGPGAAPPPPMSGTISQALPPLDAPSDRPGEHVMAGAPLGPGPGPEVLGIPQGTDAVDDYLRALWSIDPNPDIRELLEDLETGGF